MDPRENATDFYLEASSHFHNKQIRSTVSLVIQNVLNESLNHFITATLGSFSDFLIKQQMRTRRKEPLLKRVVVEEC